MPHKLEKSEELGSRFHRAIAHNSEEIEVYTTGKSSFAAAIAGLIAISPIAGLAQSEQLVDEVRSAMAEANMNTADIEKLDMLTEEQLTQVEAILANENASDMEKQDEITALMESVE
jgi:hypothetical protein